jgi:CDP-glucose 4,6-dehydratase
VEFRQGAVENLDVNPRFWEGKKVLLTGHTGFKGGWLALWLQALGARVTGYALTPPTDPSFFDTARVAGGMTSHIGDVRDLAALTAAVRQADPAIIIHMAAQSLVRPSYADPVATYSTNVMGTVNVLEAARAQSTVRAIVIVTSDKCYENAGAQREFRENDRLGGHDPYSNSKACAELVAAAYRDSFFTGGQAAAALATARAGNVIGGGDWSADRLIPDAVRAFGAGRPVQLRYPRATRPWQHVLDPLAGYLALAEKLFAAPAGYAEPWNFGPAPDQVMTVANVVDAVAKKWGGGARWEPAPGAHPHEAQFLGMDAGKAQARLAWQPRLDITQAIDWTVEWYRAWCDGADLKQLSEAQLDRYRSLAAA